MSPILPLVFFNKAAKLQGKITPLFFVPAISFFLVSVKEDFLRGGVEKKKSCNEKKRTFI